MRRSALNSLLFFPYGRIEHTPAAAGLSFEELWLDTNDGERLHAWWIAGRPPSLGHLLLCHGNAGNVGDRVVHAATSPHSWAVGFRGS